jgi:acetolactate synthase-1/3 small subunit
MRHLISMLLQNEAGALARVAGLFASRGYNIESLTVAATHDVDASRLTLVVFGDDAVIEQIIKQTAKLVDVIEIAEFTGRAEEVDAFLDALRLAADIVDHGRSGIAAIERPLSHEVRST